MALIGLLAAAATWFWLSGLTLARSGHANNAATGEARMVLDRLAREIREIKFGDATGAYCVGTRTATQFVFFRSKGVYSGTCSTTDTTSVANADYQVSVTLPAASTDLSLAYAGTQLTAVAPVDVVTSQVLASNVTALAMRYLDIGGNVTASASALRFVELTLTVRPAGGTNSTARTVVALRN